MSTPLNSIHAFFRKLFSAQSWPFLAGGLVILVLLATLSSPKSGQRNITGIADELQAFKKEVPMSAVSESSMQTSADAPKQDYARDYEGKMAGNKMAAGAGGYILSTPAYAAAGPVFQPQIIKSANVSVRVENIVSSMKKIETLTFTHHGIITQQYLSVSGPNDSLRQGNLTVRVPQRELEKFLDALDTTGVTTGKSISGQDVSAEMVDTASRIKNLKSEEAALQQIMQRSGKIAEVLEVSRELARVRGEIEQNQGRLNSLAQQVAYSTVNISLYEETMSNPTQGKPGIDTVIGNAVKSSLGSLYDFALNLIQLSIWVLLGLLPRLATGLLILLGAIKIGQALWRRFRKNSQ